MSDYGADLNPDIGKGDQVAYGMLFVPAAFCQHDQFTVDANTVVYKFNNKRKTVRLKVKANPNEISG